MALKYAFNTLYFYAFIEILYRGVFIYVRVNYIINFMESSFDA